MLEQIDRAWRVLGTGLCFALFGLGGLVLRFTAFPLLWLLVRERTARERHARGLIRWAMIVFVAVMRTLGVLDVEVIGAERLRRRGALVLANHPSLVDVVLLLALVEDAVCIVKGALSGNPFTRGPVLMAGYIRNSEGPQLVDDAVAALRAGSNLMIFPEGTRTPRSGELTLQRGAANIALRSGVDITPVVIHCRARFLTKDTPWWKVPAQKAQLRLEVGTDISVRPYSDRAAAAGRAARDLTRLLKDYFAKELAP